MQHGFALFGVELVRGNPFGGNDLQYSWARRSSAEFQGSGISDQAFWAQPHVWLLTPPFVSTHQRGRLSIRPTCSRRLEIARVWSVPSRGRARCDDMKMRRRARASASRARCEHGSGTPSAASRPCPSAMFAGMDVAHRFICATMTEAFANRAAVSVERVTVDDQCRSPHARRVRFAKTSSRQGLPCCPPGRNLNASVRGESTQSLNPPARPTDLRPIARLVAILLPGRASRRCRRALGCRSCPSPLIPDPAIRDCTDRLVNARSSSRKSGTRTPSDARRTARRSSSSACTSSTKSRRRRRSTCCGARVARRAPERTFAHRRSHRADARSARGRSST